MPMDFLIELNYGTAISGEPDQASINHDISLEGTLLSATRDFWLYPNPEYLV